MNPFPNLNIGILNGWIYFLFYLLVFGIRMLTCPEEVRKRLYDRSLWDKKTKVITAIGKLFSLINIFFILFGALQIGSMEFIIGNILYLIGLTTLIIAITDFRNAPIDKPITNGLYQYSRNPQMVSIYIMFLGMALIIGSWINLLFLSISIICAHFSILGEEKALEEQYGESYLEYKQEIPRYFIFL
jgi:protein-S-isoprenylcysteine O-methyltransferase Ste14